MLLLLVYFFFFLFPHSNTLHYCLLPIILKTRLPPADMVSTNHPMFLFCFLFFYCWCPIVNFNLCVCVCCWSYCFKELLYPHISYCIAHIWNTFYNHSLSSTNKCGSVSKKNSIFFLYSRIQKTAWGCFFTAAVYFFSHFFFIVVIVSIWLERFSNFVSLLSFLQIFVMEILLLESSEIRFYFYLISFCFCNCFSIRLSFCLKKWVFDLFSKFP